MEKSLILSKLKDKKLTDQIKEYPIFVPAVTCVKNFHNYLELVNILIHSNIDAFMLSALDLYYHDKKKIQLLLKLIFENDKKLFFLDSGGFEKFNIPHFKEKWEIENLVSVVKEFKPDIIVAFDRISSTIEQKKSEIIMLFKKTLDKLESLMPVNKKFEVVIHSHNLENMFSILDELISFGEYIYAIGIPERNLGNSIKTRLNIVKQLSNYIRNNLKWKDVYIHLMGCSAPINMINYTNLGIDIFDGVHWQDLVINPSNYDFQDYSNLLSLNCDCHYCLKFKALINQNYNYEEEYYNYYVINHNLNIYKNLWRR